MIGVIKSCLYKVVGRSAIGYFKLLTILSDIENAVNSRPLTYRCSGDSSLEIITPNCFLKPYVDNSLLFKSEREPTGDRVCSDPRVACIQATPTLTDVGTDGLVQPKVPPEAEY